METLFSLLQAPQQGNSNVMWIMMIGLFAIMYFFMIRPQNKKQKELRNFRKSLEIGQNVITAGGIHGVIKEINDEFLVVTIGDKVNVKIDVNSVFASVADAKGK
ncbi:MAG: preprotein translocase subunit YajC [Bacteroidaceae bacterium]